MKAVQRDTVSPADAASRSACTCLKQNNALQNTSLLCEMVYSVQTWQACWPEHFLHSPEASQYTWVSSGIPSTRLQASVLYTRMKHDIWLSLLYLQDLRKDFSYIDHSGRLHSEGRYSHTFVFSTAWTNLLCCFIVVTFPSTPVGEISSVPQGHEDLTHEHTKVKILCKCVVRSRSADCLHHLRSSQVIVAAFFLSF